MCTRYSAMITNKFLAFLWRMGTVLLDEPMSRHTTYRTGGPADCLFIPNNPACLGEVREMAKKEGLPFLVIGGGSNILVSDKGIRGIVARVCGEVDAGIRTVAQKDESIVVFVDARVEKKAFLEWALRRGFSGMEFMAGLPGCIGGGIAMNAGTHIGWFSDILTRVRIIDKAGMLREKDITDEMISYRELRFEEGTIIVGGYFRLQKTNDPQSIQKIVEDIIREREQKHPLEYPSAGSVFKNPHGHFAWKLINDSGLRGYAIGGAKISEKHTNFIINTGSASSTDIYKLIRHVQEVVEKETHIRLEPEVKIIGEF
ncbi:MAG: UDP-N-acetylmuramate dehydrogenase [Spirochaetes bacterium]|nr:UDP-N-acetylmuramate dehydrogenase [Spirochaetota bacterium]